MNKNLKKIYKTLTAIVLTAVLFTTMITPVFAKKSTKVPTLNSTKQTICMGKTFDFNVNNEIKGSTCQWISINKKVAAVDEKSGVVTGIDKGKTYIHCIITTSEKTKYVLIARVIVIKPAVSVEITNKITHMKVDDTYKLKVDIIPKTSTDKVTWTSSDKEIADPTFNGTFRAKKAGTVTITATALSGRSDNVTIQVLADGEVYKEPEKPVEKPVEKPKEKEPKLAKGTVLFEDFSKSTGKFAGRGSAIIKQVNEAGAEGKKGYLNVSGRSDNWNGANVDVTSLVTPGKSYEVSGWVKYTEGNDSEVLKITQQKNGSSWPQITGEVTVKKGEWTKLTGTLQVDADTTQCEVYFEMSSSKTADFLCDDFLIIDPTGEAKAPETKAPDTNPAAALPEGVVYKNDFEAGSICDSRAGSVRTNTKAYAHNGKACVEVSRKDAWDGAGVKFQASNGIKIEDLYGKTLHFSAYVMYAEGPDQVEFKINNLMGKADGTDNILFQKALKKGEWTLIEADALIAKGTTGNLIFVETVDSAVTFYMDDIEIK